MARAQKFSDPVALGAKIEGYFASLRRESTDVDEDGQERTVVTYAPPTLSGLAYYLDTTRTTLLQYARRGEEAEETWSQRKTSKTRRDEARQQCDHLLCMARVRIENYLESCAVGDARNSPGARYVLAHGYTGWDERQQIELKGDMKSKTELSGGVHMAASLEASVRQLTDEQLLSKIEALTAKVDRIARDERA